MKNATAISHGRRRLLESASEVGLGGLGVNLRVGDYRRFCGIRRTAKCGSHGRIGMRLLLLLICPKDPLGNTSGLQDSDCRLFYLAVQNLTERGLAVQDLADQR